MKSIFVDTNFWVAIINPKDQWHQRAVEKDSDLRPADRVTSELVLVEVLIMRERGIADVLTHDRNFAQEGFNPLL